MSQSAAMVHQSGDLSNPRRSGRRANQKMSMSWDEKRPLLPKDTAVLDDLNTLIPVLEQKLACGQEHHYTGSATSRVIGAVMEYCRQPTVAQYYQHGLVPNYFASPKILAESIQKVQRNNVRGPQLMVGALKIDEFMHHVTVVSVVHNDEAAVLLLDSLPFAARSKSGIKNIFNHRTSGKNNAIRNIGF